MLRTLALLRIAATEQPARASLTSELVDSSCLVICAAACSQATVQELSNLSFCTEKKLPRVRNGLLRVWRRAKKDVFGSFYFGLNCRVLITPKACISSKHSFGYHQNEVLYIIKPQENPAPKGLMRYKGGSPPLMIYAALRASM